MGTFLILLALGLAAADKLDRTYLPPPGAKFSGGNPVDLQIPLEFPKETPEATSDIPTIVQNMGLLRSDYIESTFAPNIGQFIYTTSSLKIPQLYSPYTSPISSHNVTTTSSQGNDYETTKKPLEMYKEGVNYYDSQQDELNFDYSVPNTQYKDTISKISEDSEPTHRYYAQNMPYFDIKSVKPAVLSNIRKYLNQNKEKAILSPQILDTQNQGIYQNSRFNAPVDQNIIVPSRENPHNLGINFVPVTNNYESNGTIETTQYAPGVKIMDNAFNSYRNPENKKLDSTIPTFNIKPTLGTPESEFPLFSIKPRLVSTIRKTKIALNKKNPRPKRPQAEDDRIAVIVNYNNVISPEGYSYTYDTSNGISANESGTTNNDIRAEGAYSYTGDDGKVYRVVYTADENGFLPRGDHFPPVPEAIKRLIEKVAREKEAGISDDGSYDEAKYGYKKYQGAMERYHPDFQGFTNNKMGKFEDYSRKQFAGENIRKPIKNEPVSIPHNFNGNKYKLYQPASSIRYQNANRVVLSSDQGKGAEKQLVESFTRTVGSKEFNNDFDDSKKAYELSAQQQNNNRFSNQEIAESPEAIFQMKQADRLHSQPTNEAASEYSAKLTLSPNKITPETIKNYNAHIKKNNEADKQDGYFYLTPLDRFVENGIQIINKGEDLFNTDQELEIGDDDIIPISVPSPNTSIRQDNKDVNKIQLNQPVDLIIRDNYGMSINPVDGLSIEEYTSILKKSKAQTVPGYGTSNEVADGFRRPISKADYRNPYNFDMISELYGENPQTRLQVFGNNFGITNNGKSNESYESSEIDLEKGFFGSPKQQGESPDKFLEPITKTIIGEDLTGPKRPQNFDPQTGYYY